MDAVHLQSQGLSQTDSGKTRLPDLLVVRPDRDAEGSSIGVRRVRIDPSPVAREWWLALCQLVSFAGLSVFVLAVLALHGVRANLDPAERTISEYSLGSYGWLMRAAFLALGVGTLTTAASLRLGCGPSRRRRIGLLMLAGVAIGSFLDAGFNTDRLRVPETFDGTIHSVGTSVLALALPGAAFVFGFDFVRNSLSTPKAKGLLILGAAQLGAIVLFEMSPTTLRGWSERLVTVIAVATLGLLQNLSRTCAPSSRPRTTPYSSRRGPVLRLSHVSTSGWGDQAVGLPRSKPSNGQPDP
jgi:Protein of unknown function (DUF998)